MKLDNLLPDLPFSAAPLSEAFDNIHERHLEQFPEWSLPATRRKLIVSYWLQAILSHYGFLLIVGFVIVLLSGSGSSLKMAIPGSVSAALLVFLLLFITMYWPIYQMDFLPRLDNCLESYQKKQLEGIQECKRQQYSVITLMLIDQVNRQKADIEPLLINPVNIQLVARQYGISVKSVGSAMLLIQRGVWDRKSIRKRTELLSDFQVAREHFSQLSTGKGIHFLDALEQKILLSAY